MQSVQGAVAEEECGPAAGPVGFVTYLRCQRFAIGEVHDFFGRAAQKCVCVCVRVCVCVCV